MFREVSRKTNSRMTADCGWIDCVTSIIRKDAYYV